MFYWLAICAGFQRNFRQFIDLPDKIAIYSGLTWHVVVANIKHQTSQNNINYKILPHTLTITPLLVSPVTSDHKLEITEKRERRERQKREIR